MNPCRVSWGSAGAHRPHFANWWFQEFPCVCSGPSGSVALNSQVISLVPKIKSNIIQKSIAGPFSMSPGPCHAIPCRHQYSLPTPGLVHAFKSTRAIPAAGTLYVLCLVVYYCFLILLLKDSPFLNIPQTTSTRTIAAPEEEDVLMMMVIKRRARRAEDSGEGSSGSDNTNNNNNGSLKGK